MIVVCAETLIRGWGGLFRQAGRAWSRACGQAKQPAFGFCDHRGREGFALVDALVALVIFTTTLSLCLSLADTSMKLGSRSLELRRANLLGRYLLETARQTAGGSDGRDNGFWWQVNVTSTPAPGASEVKLCARSVELRSTESGRRYGFSTVEICPPSSP